MLDMPLDSSTVWLPTTESTLLCCCTAVLWTAVCRGLWRWSLGEGMAHAMSPWGFLVNVLFETLHRMGRCSGAEGVALQVLALQVPSIAG